MEGGGPASDVWPFIILADDSCVMWNAVDLDAHKYLKKTRRVVIVQGNTTVVFGD